MQNKKKKLKRLFVALFLPDETINILDNFISKYGNLPELQSANWTPIKNLHITVLFLGSVEEDLISKIEEAIIKALSDIKPFKLDFDKITFFPDQIFPRMIWAEYKSHPGYIKIVLNLQKELDKVVNLKKEDRENIPHVTLARLKHAKKVELKQVDIPSHDVIECILMESDLSHERPIYTILSRIPLGKQDV